MITNLDKNKSKIWEDINGMVHLGRSVNDIKEALSTMGYEPSELKEILTGPFVERLMQKEQGFVEIRQAEKDLTTKRLKKDEQEEQIKDTKNKKQNY